jgi:hypothetical protein
MAIKHLLALSLGIGNGYTDFNENTVESFFPKLLVGHTPATSN